MFLYSKIVDPRIWGLGFGVQGSGLRVWGSGFGVWGSGFGVRGLGFGVQGLGLRRGARPVLHLKRPHPPILKKKGGWGRFSARAC